RILPRRERRDPRDRRGDRPVGGVPRATPLARIAGRLEGGRMRQGPRPFEHRPDPVLGAALRRALEPEGEAAFLARLLARVDEVRLAATGDAVLARWARVGVVAAAVVGLAAGYFVGRATAASTAQTGAEARRAPRPQPPVVA